VAQSVLISRTQACPLTLVFGNQCSSVALRLALSPWSSAISAHQSHSGLPSHLGLRVRGTELPKRLEARGPQPITG